MASIAAYKIKKKTVCETSVGGGNWAGLNCWNGSRCFLKIRAGLESSRLWRTTDSQFMWPIVAGLILLRWESVLVFFFGSTLPLWHNPQRWAHAEFRKNEQLCITVKERRGNLSEAASCRAQPADHFTLFPHMMPPRDILYLFHLPHYEQLILLICFCIVKFEFWRRDGSIPPTQIGAWWILMFRNFIETLRLCVCVSSGEIACTHPEPWHAHYAGDK